MISADSSRRRAEEELAAAEAASRGAAGSEPEPESSSEEEDEDAGWEEEEEAAEEAAAVAGAAAAASCRGRGEASIEAALAELDMEHYDDEDEDAAAARLFGGSRQPTYYASNAEDPHLVGESEDDEEVEDMTFRQEGATPARYAAEPGLMRQRADFVLLAARTEDDVSHLEVWVYEEGGEDGEANLYVHHDLLLPAFPLSLDWLDCPPGAAVGDSRGNFVAIGTMLPAIELWDLDVLDATEPALVLGGPDAVAAAKPGKKERKAGMKPGSHKDSVLGVAWNAEFRNVLASASADHAVKVWDIARGECVHTLAHHVDKVQAVAWNPAAASVLLSGGFDHRAALADVRTPGGAVLSWALTADVECAAWIPGEAEQFLVSTEDGHVTCLDARRGGGGSALFVLAAHDKPTSTLALTAAAPGLLATGSTDKAVKLWDISKGRPELLVTRDLRVGAVFATAFAGDAGRLLAAAGAKGTCTVWDLSCEAAVLSRWPSLQTAGRE